MVLGKRKTQFERGGKRIMRIGCHGGDAFANVARSRDTRLVAQDAG